MDASAPPSPHRAKFVVGTAVVVLVVAGIAASLFLGHESSAPPASVVAPGVIPLPPPDASAVAPGIVEAPLAAPPTASAAEAEAAPATSSATAAAPAGETPPPAAAAPPPQVNEPLPVETAAEAEAKRLAAEKARRDKAARDKADRDAKAKVLAEQRDQAAAAARAEQEAQARKRAAEAQRARPAAASTPAAPVSAQVHGVRESCTGRGTIAEAVCQSRLCASAEHAEDPVCRQLREADERRSNKLVN
jgi:colicin import membrane protein